MGTGQDHRRRARSVTRARLQPLSGARGKPPNPRTVEVAPSRLAGWVDGFATRHDGLAAHVESGSVVLVGGDGQNARISPLTPFDPAAGVSTAGSGPLVADLVRHCLQDVPLLVALVRRGGYGVAVVEGGRITASKLGTRYVQSRTAAGGWSQQRFARRRENQADQLLDAAVTTVLRVVGEVGIDTGRLVVVTGGDRRLVARLLQDPRLRDLADRPRPRHLEVPDPRRPVLDRAVAQAVAVRVLLAPGTQ